MQTLGNKEVARRSFKHKSLSCFIYFQKYPRFSEVEHLGFLSVMNIGAAHETTKGSRRIKSPDLK